MVEAWYSWNLATQEATQSEINASRIAEARRRLGESHSVAVLTGAGISAESGIPTFRGADGLWRKYSPQELATPQAFARDPKLVWEWYDWRRGLIAGAAPNAGHRALVEFESRQSPFTLITQNVDGLHDLAGSKNPARLHGDIWTLRCTACGREEHNRQVPLPDLPPECRCGAMLRPGVVWFGEGLPEPVWRRAVDAARGAETFLLVGTSATVYPAAGLVEVAREAGAHIVIVNLEPTPLDGLADTLFNAKAGEILPCLL